TEVSVMTRFALAHVVSGGGAQVQSRSRTNTRTTGRDDVAGVAGAAAAAVAPAGAALLRRAPPAMKNAASRRFMRWRRACPVADGSPARGTLPTRRKRGPPCRYAPG